MTLEEPYIANMRWSHENGSYVLRANDGIVVLRTKEPAILYNRRTGKMLRCGDRDRVAQFYAKSKRDLAKHKRVEDAEDLVFLCSRSISVTELNLCLGEPGYCLVLHRRLTVQ